MVTMYPYPPHQPTTRPPSRSAAAVASLILGILGVPATAALGLLIPLPAFAALIGAYGLRTTHIRGLRGRGMALWGFWLGVVAFLVQFGLLLIALLGMRMEA